MRICRAGCAGSFPGIKSARCSSRAGNGELLRRAADAGFEILPTADQNLIYQQNVAGSAIGVVVLIARSNTLEDLLPLVPSATDAVREVKPGEVRRVAVP